MHLLHCVLQVVPIAIKAAFLNCGQKCCQWRVLHSKLAFIHTKYPKHTAPCYPFLSMGNEIQVVHQHTPLSLRPPPPPTPQVVPIAIKAAFLNCGQKCCQWRALHSKFAFTHTKYPKHTAPCYPFLSMGNEIQVVHQHTPLSLPPPPPPPPTPQVVPIAIKAAFLNCGQNCASGERFIVQRKVCDKFTQQVVDISRNMRQGPTLGAGQQGRRGLGTWSKACEGVEAGGGWGTTFTQQVPPVVAIARSIRQGPTLGGGGGAGLLPPKCI
jgi:hypothetical protein